MEKSLVSRLFRRKPTETAKCHTDRVEKHFSTMCESCHQNPALRKFIAEFPRDLSEQQKADAVALWKTRKSLKAKTQEARIEAKGETPAPMRRDETKAEFNARCLRATYMTFTCSRCIRPVNPPTRLQNGMCCVLGQSEFDQDVKDRAEEKRRLAHQVKESSLRPGIEFARTQEPVSLWNKPCHHHGRRKTQRWPRTPQQLPVPMRKPCLQAETATKTWNYRSEEDLVLMPQQVPTTPSRTQPMWRLASPSKNLRTQPEGFQYAAPTLEQRCPLPHHPQSRKSKPATPWMCHQDRPPTMQVIADRPGTSYSERMRRESRPMRWEIEEEISAVEDFWLESESGIWA